MPTERTQTVTRDRGARRRVHPGRLSLDTEATVDLSDREHLALPVPWQLHVSHYVEKVRWALDYKRIPHIRRSLLPGLHAVKTKRLTGDTSTAPVLTPPSPSSLLNCGNGVALTSAQRRPYLMLFAFCWPLSPPSVSNTPG